MAAAMDLLSQIAGPISKEPTPLEVGAEVVDEDGSSQSPSSPDLFDRPEPATGDASLTWQRLSSLESTTSTSMTSLGSSASADEHRLPLTPSRKRTVDGRIKLGSPRDTVSASPKHDSKPVESRGKTTPLRITRHTSQSYDGYRPRSSIPASISATAFANQCLEAAAASRLDPYALSHGEHKYLRDLITSSEATIYLNIRNAILRLWLRNPICSVTPEEAAGCARDARYFGLADFAYKWLVRHGYINFGCVEPPKHDTTAAKAKKTSKQKTVVVIGAGVSGLTTARQLEHQFDQHRDHWLDQGELPPRVVVLEGRKRIGGRVYSKPLRSQTERDMPGQYRNTAEMGAMIVTGFERGNPLDTIIRAQLGIPYHMLKDALTIYDCDGKPVNEKRDMLNTDLYTDISDRTGEFRAVATPRETLRGDEDLISRGRDPAQHGPTTEFQVEPAFDDDAPRQRKPVSKRGRRTNAPPGNEKLTGRSEIVEGGDVAARAVRTAQDIGWQVKDGVSREATVSLRQIVDAHHRPSLGSIMDAAIKQYQELLNIKPRDMRLLNWHHANLEYANAAPVTSLSLSGHDQDNGNEFEGAHSEVIGGYTQMPRGLMNLPTKLDVRLDHVIDSIHYDAHASDHGSVTAKVVCTNGTVIEADEVVCTVPLGVLKKNTIDFDPPLPEWKEGAIERMGFGLLNKVILVYDRPFWDDSRDMFGLLNEAEVRDSLDPQHYERRRGRFYLIWNASRISGRPMLIALMAGHAAEDAEHTTTAELLAEVTDRLRKVFTPAVPAPREVIVTRWRRDPFARGTYSYVAPETQPNDYNLMAEPIGNLHFAGEATCGTHPATVHGAFLSGLRAAADVMDAMAGEIKLPVPLVGEPLTSKNDSQHSTVRTVAPPRMRQPPRVPKSVVKPATAVIPLPTIKTEVAPVSISAVPWVRSTEPTGPPSKSVCAGDPSFWISSSFEDTPAIMEATIASIVFAEVGERPSKPSRAGVNPFLLYTRAQWDKCKLECEQEDRDVGRSGIRQVLGQWWKDMSDAARQPYLDQSKAAQAAAEKERRAWSTAVAQWDASAARIRQKYLQDNPQHNYEGGSSRRKTNVSTNMS